MSIGGSQLIKAIWVWEGGMNTIPQYYRPLPRREPSYDAGYTDSEKKGKYAGDDFDVEQSCTWVSVCTIILIVLLMLLVLSSAVGYGGLGYYDDYNRGQMPLNHDRWWCQYCDRKSCPPACWST